MRILKDFKIPDFKIPKFKMPGILNIEELKIEYEKLKEKKDLINYNVKRYSTIQEMFDEVTEKFKDNICIVEKFDHKEEYTEISYSKFREDVIGFGTGLINLFEIKDKRVVIIGENTYNWYVSYMALLCGGIIAVPVDKELPANEIENIIKRSNASAIIYSPRKKEVIDKIKNNLQNVSYFVEMYSNKEIVNNDVGFNYVANIGKQLYKSGNNTLLSTKIEPDEFKVLLFTSGTTSSSKGVMLCNRNLADNIYGSLSYVTIYSKDRLFSILPLHHTYESTIGFLVPISIGASIAVCEGLKYIVQNLKETKPTVMLAVPLLVENLYKKITASIKKSKKEGIVNSMIHVTNALKAVNIDIKRKVFSEIYDNLGGNIRIIVSAAAPIDAKIGKWVEDIGITFLQGYGLTETAPIAALTPEIKPKVGSAGIAVPCSEINIMNPNENGEGEILIKSTTLMLGYYENEEATKEVIVDGWFYSGDIGYMDEEGYLYITGRCKNVIVTSNGKNIYPEELEIILAKIPYIKECMVYGMEDGDKDNLKIAVKVIVNDEYIAEHHSIPLSKKEVHDIIWNAIKMLNRTLTSYKAITHLEIKDDEFEKTTTLKIKRFAELKKDEEKKKLEKK
ncbi:MAG: AMP-binding protein [Clostridia bacterium]|nr:AMP-binding protein [Clostridia bacterium]MDD4386289.1 AMP-binding protein [Clostridia bacterium]